uniref:C2 domain-containing protein n=1 Tax=Kalanchoe fedtschenkoi TaxID=63787 RepID=A0A7N0TIQ5_KALFE
MHAKVQQQSSQLRTLPLFIFSRMDSFDQNPELPYNSNSLPTHDSEGSFRFSGILEVLVHHARDIHNICIYENQDVYAKFALTYNPDEAVSTRVIMGGGKNPDFNESISMRISNPEAILKCEIWMLSRARNYMEDQLLGFALVPISSVVGKGKITQDFSLSSTDLFHSPAGTVKLSLSLNTSPLQNFSSSTFSVSPPTSSISSEVMLVDRNASSTQADPFEYTSIEFPDINVVKENQKMVSEYFDLASHSDPRHELVSTASFLCLGASSQPIEDFEMVLNPSGSTQISGSLDRNTPSEPVCNKNPSAADLMSSHDVSIIKHAHCQSVSSDPAAANKRNEIYRGKQIVHSGKDGVREKEHNTSVIKIDAPFSAANNVSNEVEQSAMQQQIVDMYMKSMQQFTESLAKMKLPMSLGKPEHEAHGEVIQNRTGNSDMDTNNKKDGSSRVFYGSRAFF